MNLTQQKLDGLLAQLNMAMAKHPPSTIQIAIIKARILELQQQKQKAVVKQSLTTEMGAA